MGISAEFAKFGATLNNVQWSVSAYNKKGELVLSLWQHFFGKAVAGKICYEDKVSRWSGAGNNEFRRNLEQAYASQQVIRAVIARTSNQAGVISGQDASQFKNSFAARPEWIGKVLLWDGDRFILEFEKDLKV